MTTVNSCTLNISTLSKIVYPERHAHEGIMQVILVIVAAELLADDTNHTTTAAHPAKLPTRREHRAELARAPPAAAAAELLMQRMQEPLPYDDDAEGADSHDRGDDGRGQGGQDLEGEHGERGEVECHRRPGRVARELPWTPRRPQKVAQPIRMRALEQNLARVELQCHEDVMKAMEGGRCGEMRGDHTCSVMKTS